MSDVRVRVDGSTTVRVYGLDAKATSIGTAQFELESLLSDGLRLGNSALEAWRGKHAEAFVENANRLVRELDRLVTKVATAKRTADRWPDPARRDPFGDEAASSERLAVTVEPGTSAAVPERLDEFRSWCDAVAERVPWLTGSVNLDGVTADVTRPVPVSGLVAVPLGSGLLVEEPGAETITTTSTALPGTYVHLPDVSAGTTRAVDSAAGLGPWTGAVALAFRLGDERLLALVEAHPDLADELLAGFDDQQLGGESALVVLLAYFSEFDSASNDGEDGEVSWDDLWVMSLRTDLPPYVAQAARYLHDNPTLFALVETMNDDMEYPRDVLGGNGDHKISVGDIETFVEFDDQLAVLEQSFDAFDSAAHPGEPRDGQISMGDLRALAEGDGALADAASWLLDHDSALDRLLWYGDAKQEFLSEPPAAITAASLVLLTVDQQVYADDPRRSASFVDRRFETLMNEDVGGCADPRGIGAVFDAALTRSDQRAPLMERVIAEVAADGTIHNAGLPGAFANGAAANMALLDQRTNAPFAYGPRELPEDVRRAYLDTHDFFREVSRSPDAAERLRQGVYDYGLSETALAPDSGEVRQLRLGRLGRVHTLLDMAQDNALTGAALDDLRAATEGSALGPSPGSATDYGISQIPVAGTINDIADGMGISAGDGLDWLLGQLGEDSPDAFDRLSDAEKIDRIRKLSSRVDGEVWVALDRFDSDPATREAARGQPFVAADGTLKPDMTGDEAQAFREWAAWLAQEDGLTHSDTVYVGGGANDILTPPAGLSVEDRR